MYFFNSYEGNPDALKTLTIHAGTNLLSETGTVYKAKQAIAHRDFSSFELVNDIGLLILSTLIEYTKYIQPIPLATTNFTPAGSTCTLSGWGRTSVNIKQKLFYVVKAVSSLSNIYRILFINFSKI